MRRRDFLITSGSLATATLPEFAYAARPCPPPVVSTGSQSTSTTCVAPNGTYTTNFPLTENPISQGGRWLGGFTDGVMFKDVRTTPGRAFASGINNTYDDSLAILNSPAIANDHYVEVVVYLEPGYTAPSSHEIELLLRGNISRNVNHLSKRLAGRLGRASNGRLRIRPVGYWRCHSR
jgi:hypothetical protein